MKKYILHFLTIASILSGCINIEETYTFKEDGSGSCTFKIDMSELKQQMDRTSDKKNTQQAALQAINLETEKTNITAINGISNVVTKTEKSLYIFELSYDFSTVEALNTATNVVLESERQSYFVFKGKNVSFNHPLPQQFIDASNAVENENIKTLFEKVSYQIVLKFERPIKKLTSEAKIILSEDKKQVVIKSNFSELLKTPTQMNAAIKLK
jgi:hypothetical protein